MRVLNVEDNGMIRELTDEILSAAGYEPVSTDTGDNAIAIISAANDPFDALVTDYHMPGMANGIGVAAYIRNKFPGTPVVMTSGRPEWADVILNIAPAYVFLRKPYGPKDLIKALETALEAA